MATNYKILGQGVNSLKIDAPENGSTIISELKIKNTSYPTNVDVMCSDEFSSLAGLDGFNPDPNNSVFSIALQPDGKILIGGLFTTIGGTTTRNRIARLNSDGSLDTGFDPNASNWVSSIALQPDGKILIGGSFTVIGATIGGTTRNRIARLNSDGSLDTGFNPNANSTVSSIALQPDGKILIGGSFTTIGGTTRNFLARLNSDGTLDTGFNPNANSNVNSIALQPDGKILIGGLFTTIGGTTRNRIARLNSDGSLDTGFNPNANSTVGSIALQPDGKILIAGSFTTIGGTTRNRIVRLNSDGSLDTGFDPNSNAAIGSIALQPDGKILIGGGFDEIAGIPRNFIVRLNSDGTLDTGFDPNIFDSGQVFVGSIALQPDGKILIAGSFTTIGGTTRNRIARLGEYFVSENKNYIIKNKPLSYDEEIKISGGIALEPGQSLAIETTQYNPGTVVIQAYGIEETS
jgi:uncharacterized delta-60 repeat protein